MSTETLTYRDRTYQRHPLSALFLIIVGEEFESLKASINDNGLRQPILLAAKGSDEVLDGWNRLRGCIETAFEARFEHAAADADLIKISLDFNLSRRHLTAGQKAMIAAEIADV
jgi:ParB-like chromosome segregation protein Spo0J